MKEQIGVVAIGRNEGDRLEACLKSVSGQIDHVVYVDSGSTDGSLELARSLGADVVLLDSSRPFSAARARNAGMSHLIQTSHLTQFIQFIDGDCQVAAGWFEAALAAMDRERQLAVVCGRRRERFRERSVYNRLCDMEWDTPIGEARACGGDALMRVSALRQVGGYNESVIAGEEPELCVRLRQRGWKVWRIEREMTLHDAAMFHFWQWWQRMKRSGHAYAEGVALHGAPPERHCRQETRSIWFWGLVWPALVALAVPLTQGVSLAALLAYPLWVVRVAYRRRHQYSDRWSDCWLYGISCALGKWPQLVGQLSYVWRRMAGRPSTLIEYKGESER